MRILQLIDSLEAGGAERMAVNFANSLRDKVELTALCATRAEGVLKTKISPEVRYCFLRKKSAVDVAALWRLRKFCVGHNIDVVHAHGSSFFMATLLKMTLFRLRVIWHEHNGNRDSQSLRENRVLKYCSYLFCGIIVVNGRLEQWMKNTLRFKNVICLPNFVLPSPKGQSEILKGADGKRVLYLANLRYPKNHLLVVEAASILRGKFPQWTYHFVGIDHKDAYSNALRAAVSERELGERVYIYGQKNETESIISQSDICLIASTYEGLPVALLEYGNASKAVVATAVGEIPVVLEDGKSGLLSDSGDAVAYSAALGKLMESDEKREAMGKELKKRIDQTYSEKPVLKAYLEWVYRC